MSVVSLLRLHEPVGPGVYVRDITRPVHGSPAEAAAQAARHGITWVALAALWLERAMNVHDLPDYGQAFRDSGIAVWVWGYPEAGAEAHCVELLRRGAELAGAVGLILDPEAPYKGRPDEAAELMRLTIDALDERLGLGVTSYPVPRAHPTFPWQAFGGYGWGSPQTYRLPVSRLAEAHAGWRALGWDHIVPSVPAFGPHAGDGLRDYLAAQGDVPGVIAWDWSQLDGREWRALAEWGSQRV